ncbi:hypothetical protein LOTGIDRAFT_237328 [Lottia gigantea]|uniref:MYCBP-associated protein n=1 Tax=Lottia gigantea TaxID=225164 RepID=V4BFG1_LOTGI|nr:hypothetical protein LOTGIDRAFT_237328 [Lottia gigantea]ESP04592.1 hypothetical protein LOTGIDRAFT_237328 [Lottia gigantea]
MIPQKGKKVTLGQLGALLTGGGGGTGGRKKSVVRSSSSSCVHVDNDKKNNKKKKGSEKSVSSLQDICPPPKPAVLWNEEIAKLSILRNPWQKGILVKQKPKKKVTKYSIKKFKPKKREVVVSYPAEKSAPCKPYIGQSNPCIKFDKDGHIVPYCILGTEEEFFKQSSKKGQLIPEDEEDILCDDRESSELSGSATSQIPQSAYWAHVDEKRALLFHEETLVERKIIRKRLAESTKREERYLVMSDDFRQLKVDKNVMVNNDKHNFWDTEKKDTRSTGFWKLSSFLSQEIGGCHYTLTQAEQGWPKSPQLIGFPICTVQERVMGAKTKIPTVYSTPDTTKLYMKGTAQGGSICVSPGWENLLEDEEKVTVITPREIDFWNKQLYVNPDGTWKSFSSTDEDSRCKMPVITITGAYNYGPRIRLCGQAAKWYPKNINGGTVHAEAGEIGPINNIISFNVTLVNCGSTVLYYEWQKRDKERPFGILRPSKESFYFNDHTGTLVQGERKTIPCMFKSPTAGSFSEQWTLFTKPNLCGQGEIILTLWGLATTEDVDIYNRKSVDEHLSEKMKETAIKFTIESILERVCTPSDLYTDRNIPPTGSDLFQYKNRLPYNSVNVHDILQLANIVDSSHRFTTYNISIKRLNKLIRRKEMVDDLLNEDDPDNPIVLELGQESLLKELNTIISKLSFPSFIPSLDRKSEICRGMLSNSVDKFVDVSQKLKEMYGVKIEKVIQCKENVNEPTVKKSAKEGKEKKGSSPSRNEKHGSKGSKVHVTEKHHSAATRRPTLTEIIYILKEDPEIYRRYCDKLYIACQVIMVELADNIEKHFSCLN